MALQRAARQSAPALPQLLRVHSRFRLRVSFMGGGLKPYGWEIYDEEDGKTVRRSPGRFRTSAEAWQAGLTLLDRHDTGDC